MYHQQVSIVIPNYNGERLLVRSLPEVIRATQSYPGESEILVVDDGSKDKSIQVVESLSAQVRIIHHETNKGFSEAVRSGVENARHDIIILLNTDVYPSETFISPLIKWFEYQDTFSVSPLIVVPGGTPMGISWNMVDICKGELRFRSWNLDHAQRLRSSGLSLLSLFASGGSVAFKKSMFLKLGGFLPMYAPFYYEDRDLCTRAWSRGWKTYFEPESMVIHHHWESTIDNTFSPLFVKAIKKRNRFLYHWLYLSSSAMWSKHVPWLMVRLLSRLLRCDMPFILGFIKSIPMIPRMLESRRALQSKGHFKTLEEIQRVLDDPRLDS